MGYSIPSLGSYRTRDVHVLVTDCMSFRSIREWAGRNPRTVAAIATASTAVTWFTSQHAEQISNNVAEETYNVAEEVKGIWDAGFTQAREKVSDLCEKLPALTGMIRPQRRIQPARRPTEERKRPAEGPPAEDGAAPGAGAARQRPRRGEGVPAAQPGPLPTSRTIADFYVGQRVKARHLASTMGPANTHWFHGRVCSISIDASGDTVSIDYDDGDHEDGVYLCFVVCAVSNGRAQPRYFLSHF